ncbi:MAG: hypothetical protein U1E56_13675 [Bauldia sp.]
MALSDKIREKKQAVAFLAGASAIAIAAGAIFVSMWQAEPIVAGPGVTRQLMLGNIERSLYGGPGDTPVFELEGEKPGASILVLGGTHPQEIAGMIAATLIVENVKVKQGKITVVPQANRSGFTWTEPMEAYRHHIDFKLPDGKGTRWFRVGMRLANPVDQWPDPDLFVHYPTGEQMVGHESRNLNRNHPGREDGWLVARVSHGLTQIAAQSSMTFDQHEAQPEYSVVNAFVAPERAYELAGLAQGKLASNRSARIPITMQKSPVNLHGLSHREFNDFTDTLAVLAETANPAMGRFRGKLSDELVVGGKDANYVAAAKLKSDNPTLGRLFVRFDENGWPLDVRVARHLASIQAIINAYNDLHPENPLVVENYPDYRAVVEKGIGAFLQPPPKR